MNSNTGLLVKKASGYSNDELFFNESNSLKQGSFQGKFVHIGPKFVEGMDMVVTPQSIQELLQSLTLQEKVNRVCITNNQFNFHVNGFEFLDFSTTSLGKAITKLATGYKKWEEIPEETITAHAEAVEEAFTAWGREKGISFSKVVWVDTVYRNSMDGKFGPVHFVHCDFPDEDFSQTLKGHETWKERVEKKLMPLTKEQYEALPVSKIMNIWMPLDETIEAEPLAMMDIVSLKADRDLKVYQDARLVGGSKYPSVGVYPADQQQWYIRDRMKRGEAVVFDSCRTPHSAVSLPDQGGKGRRSVESRVIFLAERSKL